MLTEFRKLNRLLILDIEAFDRAIREMTPNQLDLYMMNSRQTGDIINHIEKAHPRLFIYALFAGACKTNKNDPEFPKLRSGIFTQIPINFDPNLKIER
jgi:hypothetical protein